MLLFNLIHFNFHSRHSQLSSHGCRESFQHRKCLASFQIHQASNIPWNLHLNLIHIVCMCRRLGCCLVWALSTANIWIRVERAGMFFRFIIWKLRKHITTLPASSLRVDRSTRPKFLVTSKHETKIELISHPRASGNRSLTNKLRQFIMLIALLFWGLQNNSLPSFEYRRIGFVHRINFPLLRHPTCKSRKKSVVFLLF